MNSDSVTKIDEFFCMLEEKFQDPDYLKENRDVISKHITVIQNELSKKTPDESHIVNSFSVINNILAVDLFLSSALIKGVALKGDCLEQYIEHSSRCGADPICLGVAFAILMVCLAGELVGNEDGSTVHPDGGGDGTAIPTRPDSDFDEICDSQSHEVAINPRGSGGPLRVRIKNVGTCDLEYRAGETYDHPAIIGNVDQGSPPMIINIPQGYRLWINCGSCIIGRCRYIVE